MFSKIKPYVKRIFWDLRYRVKYFLPEDLPSESYALSFLNQYHPDPNSSVFCKNVVHAPQCDLTIVIPVYNVEQYLEDCLKSVLKQNTQFSYRVIAVNDGSTDQSAEILHRFSDDNRLIVHEQTNKGLSGARNEGIKEIFSNYVMFVDSDDILPETAVESLMKEAYAADADIVQGSFASFLDKSGKILGRTNFPRSQDNKNISNIGGTAWGKVYRSTLWERLCFPENYWFEDTVITSIHRYLASKISTVDDIVYMYRLRSGSITSTSVQKKKSVDTFWITAKMLSARKELALDCNAEYYEYLLRQAVMNYKRTAKQPQLVQQCIFILTRKMFREERPQGYVPTECKYSKLDNAILNGTYNEYRYRCSMWR